MEHLRHGRTEDIGVEESYLITQTGKGYGKVGRDGRLTDTALTGTDSNDILNMGEKFADFGTGLGLELSLYLYLYVLTTVVFDGGLSSLYGGFEERIGVAGEFEDNGDFLSVDGGLVGNHVALYEVLLSAGIGNGSQRIHDKFRI